jgi:hypothetical protein
MVIGNLIVTCPECRLIAECTRSGRDAWTTTYPGFLPVKCFLATDDNQDTALAQMKCPHMIDEIARRIAAASQN